MVDTPQWHQERPYDHDLALVARLVQLHNHTNNIYHPIMQAARYTECSGHLTSSESNCTAAISLILGRLPVLTFHKWIFTFSPSYTPTLCASSNKRCSAHLLHWPCIQQYFAWAPGSKWMWPHILYMTSDFSGVAVFAKRFKRSSLYSFWRWLSYDAEAIAQAIRELNLTWCGLESLSTWLQLRKHDSRLQGLRHDYMDTIKH